MNRDRALKSVLGIVGVLFLLLSVPMVTFIRIEAALSMMLCLYVTLGVFLLFGIRRPWESRSVIAFTAWSSLVHAGWMGAQVLLGIVQHGELIGCAVLLAIGVTLLALAPVRPASSDRVTSG